LKKNESAYPNNSGLDTIGLKKSLLQGGNSSRDAHFNETKPENSLDSSRGSGNHEMTI